MDTKSRINSLDETQRKEFRFQLGMLRVVTVAACSMILNFTLNSDILRERLNNGLTNPLGGYGEPTIGYIILAVIISILLTIFILDRFLIRLTLASVKKSTK